MRWFRICHPNHSLRVVQNLEMGIARGLCPKNVQSPYNNLAEMYGKHNSMPSQIWNVDEFGAQAGRNWGGGALCLPHAV